MQCLKEVCHGTLSYFGLYKITIKEQRRLKMEKINIEDKRLFWTDFFFGLVFEIRDVTTSSAQKRCVTFLQSIVNVLRPWQTRTHCCGHIVAVTNVSPFAHAGNICCGPKFVSGTQKMFLILFRNIFCPQQIFPSLRSTRNIMSNNVSATMCPRLPGPLY